MRPCRLPVWPVRKIKGEGERLQAGQQKIPVFGGVSNFRVVDL